MAGTTQPSPVLRVVWCLPRTPVRLVFRGEHLEASHLLAAAIAAMTKQPAKHGFSEALRYGCVVCFALMIQSYRLLCTFRSL
jgi:hypothetical protein